MFKEAVNTYKLMKNIKMINDPEAIKSKKASKAIYDLLLQEKGIFLKIGQALGSSHRFEEYQDIQKLTEQSNQVLPLSEIEEHIYSVIPKSEILSLEESVSPGSLGQVHKAKLKSGEEIAIKVLYPEIKEKIQSQLSLLNILPSVQKVSTFNKWHFPISEYQAMIQRVLNYEQSYMHEMQNQRKWEKQNKIENVKTSHLYPEYSSDNVLTQSWINGDHLHYVAENYSKDDKRKAAKLILKSYLNSLLNTGFVQIDNHDGNFFFTKEDDLSVYYIDFGNCIEIPKQARLALIYLIHNTICENDINLLGTYELLGFASEKLRHSKDCLNVISKYLFEPFVFNHAYNLNNWHLNEKLEMALGEHKWWFRSAGDTLVFQMMRSLMGMISILKKLDMPIMWKDIFYEVVDLKEIENFEKQIPIYNIDIPSFKSMAQNLNILIYKDGVEKVNLNMPVSVVVELETVINSEIRSKLLKRNIFIKDIIQEALRSGLKAQELFCLKEGNNCYTISLK